MNAGDSSTEVGAVRVGPQARVYTEGWQSWSPATWYALDEPQHRPDLGWQHTMRFRPGTALAHDAFQAEGVLAVDPGDGGPVQAWLPVDPTGEVPTLHARKRGDHLVVTAQGGAVRTIEARDGDAALAAVGDALAAGAGTGPLRSPGGVWCTWYRYFEAVTDDDILRDVAAMDQLEVPVDVVQIDDGWTLGVGESFARRPSFGSLERAVDGVRASGRRAGIWLAPFLVGRDSTVAREHPDWLMGDAGENWGTTLAGLDLTHPGVRDHLTRGFAEIAQLGVDYVKLDFLYGGALPGRRHSDMTGIEAYRSGMNLIREVVGPQTYLLGCGAPLLPSLGLVDAMRVSPDTYHEGGQDGSVGLRGQLSLEGRTWQHGRLWVTDPDCIVARPTFPPRHQWAEIARRSGGLRSVSDRFDELDDEGLALTIDYLSDTPSIEPLIGAPAELPGGAA